MKKLVFSVLVGLLFLTLGVTSATASEFKSGMVVASMDKCGAGKCGGEKKCGASKCGGDNKAKKCGSGKCGS